MRLLRSIRLGVWARWATMIRRRRRLLLGAHEPGFRSPPFTQAARSRSAVGYGGTPAMASKWLRPRRKDIRRRRRFAGWSHAASRPRVVRVFGRPPRRCSRGHRAQRLGDQMARRSRPDGISDLPSLSAGPADLPPSTGIARDGKLATWLPRPSRSSTQRASARTCIGATQPGNLFLTIPRRFHRITPAGVPIPAPTIARRCPTSGSGTACAGTRATGHHYRAEVLRRAST